MVRIHKERFTKRFFIEAVTTGLLVALPADLLYLYYIGVWYEPNKTLELAELVILYAVPLFAIWRHYLFLS